MELLLPTYKYLLVLLIVYNCAELARFIICCHFRIFIGLRILKPVHTIALLINRIQQNKSTSFQIEIFCWYIFMYIMYNIVFTLGIYTMYNLLYSINQLTAELKYPFIPLQNSFKQISTQHWKTNTPILFWSKHTKMTKVCNRYICMVLTSQRCIH